MLVVFNAARRWASRTCLLAFMLLPCASFADTGDFGEAAAEEYPPLVENLFANEIAFAQERGELEISSTLGFARDAEWSAPLSVELEYGITSRWQISVGVPWTWSGEADGERGAASAGVLYNMLPPEHGAALSVAVEITEAEVEDDEAQENESGAEVELALLLARTYDDAEVHVSLAGARSGGESELTFGAGAVLVTRGLLPSIEVSASHSDEAFTAYLTPGVHWQAGEVELGLGVSIGLNSDSSELAGIAALTIEF